MSTLADFRALIKVNFGGRDDADALLVTDAAINYAALLAALVFEPPELRTSGDLTVAGGSDSVSFGSLTNLLDILTVYNTTDNNPMWFIPHELWQVIVPSSIGSTKYYSVFGETIYVKDAPSVNKTLKVYYSTYPAKLVNSTDVLEFDYHDSYIVSTASAIVLAAFEEGESAGIWQKVAEAVGVPLMLGARARQVIAGQRLTLESAIELAGSKE